MNMSYVISLKEQQELQGISTLALLGSVSAGKTSMCKFLTGETTQKHSAELVNGCTIKMGYKNLKIYFNGSSLLTNPKTVPNDYKLIRHFSIADNPGHNSFMATLVTGITNIDNALFLISGTEGIEPQSHQHLKCFKSTEIENLAMIISKVDLIPTQEKLKDIIKSVDKFMEKENLSEDIDPPIIPISSFSNTNTDALIKYIVASKYPKNIKHIINQPFDMTIIRSFDNNKPGTSINNLVGATFGGAIQSGFLSINDMICIFPGEITYNGDDVIYTPLITKVCELRSNTSNMDVAIPGGFIAINTTLDPCYGRADKMVGNIIKKINNIDDLNELSKNVINEIEISNLEELTDEKLIVNQEYLVVVHASGQMAKLVSIDDNKVKFILKIPIYASINDKIAVLKKHDNAITMLSYGRISNTNITNNIKMVLQDDINDIDFSFNNKTIDLIDDLEIFPIFEDYIDSLYNQDELISNIKFSKLKFTVDCPSVILSKDTTSFVITNSKEIFINFTDEDNIINLATEFGYFVKSQYKDELIKANINVDVNTIAFHDVKKALRKFHTTEFNKHLENFISLKFTCPTCKVKGSMFFKKKEHYCRACNAVSMIKK